MSTSTTFAPQTLRDSKMRNGTSGFAVRDSRTRKAMNDAIEAAPNAMVWADPHPTSVVRMIARLSEKRHDHPEDDGRRHRAADALDEPCAHQHFRADG